MDKNKSKVWKYFKIDDVDNDLMTQDGKKLSVAADNRPDTDCCH